MHSLSQPKFIRAYIILTVAMLSLVACQSNSPSEIVPTVEQATPSPAATAEPTPTIEIVAVPTRMVSLANGVFTYNDGCFKIGEDQSNGGLLLVWSLDQYSIDLKQDKVVFTDHTVYGTSGEWEFGSTVSSGGGGTSRAFISNFPYHPIPDTCTGSLWLIGSPTSH